jgi:tetratricopeptide (TPR) repeat protein
LSHEVLDYPFFLLLFLSEGYADNRNLDSLLSLYQNSAEGFERISAIQNLFEFYLNNDPSKAKEYAILQMEYSQSIQDTLGIGMASYNMAVLHNNKSNYDSATYWYEEAYAFFKQIDNIERMALAKYGLAILDYYRGDYDSALKLLGETIQLLTRDQKV